MSLQRGRRPDGELHQHPGYSAIDHQLDPLVEVIRDWADPAYMPPQTEEERARNQAVALDAIAAVEHAMKHLRWQIKNPEAW